MEKTIISTDKLLDNLENQLEKFINKDFFEKEISYLDSKKIKDKILFIKQKLIENEKILRLLEEQIDNLNKRILNDLEFLNISRKERNSLINGIDDSKIQNLMENNKFDKDYLYDLAFLVIELINYHSIREIKEKNQKERIYNEFESYLLNQFKTKMNEIGIFNILEINNLNLIKNQIENVNSENKKSMKNNNQDSCLEIDKLIKIMQITLFLTIGEIRKEKFKRKLELTYEKQTKVSLEIEELNKSLSIFEIFNDHFIKNEKNGAVIVNPINELNVFSQIKNLRKLKTNIETNYKDHINIINSNLIK